MPGIPTHFVILEKTYAALKTAPQQSLRDIAGVIERNSPYAYLGAVGPAIGDFIPAGPPGILGQYVKAWQGLFDIISGWGTPGHPGLINIVKIAAVIDELQAIAKAEDLGKLQAIKSELDQFGNTSGALTILLGELQDRALAIVNRINASGPMLPTTPGPGSTIPSVNTWLTRDVLHWKKTGHFAKALLDRAGHDERFLAYAYGYITAYSANVTGAPFINSIVLGPYRTAWWRHRFVQNWIDAWVYGANGSEAKMGEGDTPEPPYDAWPSLCGAQLQKNIELPDVVYDPIDLMNKLPKGFKQSESHGAPQPFPVLLPPEFGTFWVQAYTDAYGPPAPDSPVKAENLNGAYVMTWLTLWFQTASLGCNPPPAMEPPDDCGVNPSWVDPTVPGDNGAGGTPPPPGGYEQVNTAEEVCGWILAILGGLVTLGGGLVAGGAAIAGGAALIADAHSVDWKKLRCDLYWYRQYYFTVFDHMHSILLLAGFDFPRAAELADNTETAWLLGTNYLSGINLCKSRQRMEGFPSKPWQPNLVTPGDWTAAPTDWENPQRVAYMTSAYPSFFVDDPANPLINGEVRIGGTWPPGFRHVVGSDMPVQFGNAVANAVDLFAHINDAPFPDWNLDADRGLAYLTWQFHNAMYTDPVAIDPEA